VRVPAADLGSHNGKVIFIGNGKVEMAVAGGIFVRMLFHCQKPISLIKAMLENTPEKPEWDHV